MTKTKLPPTVSKPALSLTGKTGETIALWVGNPGQTIAVSDYRGHVYPVSKTASLVYEVQSINQHTTDELPLDHASTWGWVEKWMERGWIAEGHMTVDQSKHWREVDGKIVIKTD